MNRKQKFFYAIGVFNVAIFTHTVIKSMLKNAVANLEAQKTKQSVKNANN